MRGKKKRGLFRSAAGGLARAGGATVKGTAKVAGKTAKVGAKGTYGAGKVTTKATYRTGKVTAKGGYITMKTGGRTFLFAARKAYPRRPEENKWQYRRRMAKLGFKVSLWTGDIVMAANNSANVQQFAITLAANTAKGKAQDLFIHTVMDSYRTNENP
tara:strand:+ start:190 stop:663 length:474 start_codon:yes stop_codon:yes gene_type:complete